MAVKDHPVHPSTVSKEGDKYGCWNKPRPVAFGPVTGSISYGMQRWRHTMSTGCRQFPLWDSDPKCAGCTAERDIQYAEEMQALQ